jgi:AraC-like DNA-binding protein
MDPLSDLLSLLEPRSYITAGFDAGGSWALELDDLAGRIKCYAVLRGTCWLRIETDPTPVCLAEGDCFILPRGLKAVIASDLDATPFQASLTLDPNRSGEVVTYQGGGDVFLVGSRFAVSGKHAELMLETLPPLIRIEAAQDSAKFRLFIELMMEELREGRPGACQVAQNLSHMMLAQALRLFVETMPEGQTGWLAALADARLGTAISAMFAAPGQNWTLEELAGLAGMSRTSFAERFRHRVGEPPLAYLARWRMISAAARLMRGTESIPAIALSLGYSSEHGFNTAFKRIMGQPPRRYARAQGPSGA